MVTRLSPSLRRPTRSVARTTSLASASDSSGMRIACFFGSRPPLTRRRCGRDRNYFRGVTSARRISRALMAFYRSSKLRLGRAGQAPVALLGVMKSRLLSGAAWPLTEPPMLLAKAACSATTACASPRLFTISVWPIVQKRRSTAGRTRQLRKNHKPTFRPPLRLPGTGRSFRPPAATVDAGNFRRTPRSEPT